VRILPLGRRPYAETEAAMRAFTHARAADTEDELWLVEHEPVFTQGIAGRDAHVLDAGGIPVVRTDRGGQVTYHGPGQVVAYPLLDLRRIGRAGIYVKEYVFRLEEAVIETLAPPPTACAARRASTCGWPTPSATVRCRRRARTPSPGWARSPRWASRSASTAPTTAWR